MKRRSYFPVALLSCCVLITIKTAAASNSEAVLIWAQRFGTWSKFRSLSGQSETFMINSTRFSSSQPQSRTQYSALNYNPRTDTIYWVDKSNLGFIMFQNRLNAFMWPATAPNKLNAFSNITKFTVDWATNNIYFIDSYGAISVMTEKKGKTLVNVIHSLNVDNPVSITCDVEKGYLFWSDASARAPRIERSILNGDDRMVLVESPDTLKPSSIAIEGSNLFWVEESSMQVKSCDYNGDFVRIHLSFGSNRMPQGIAAFGEVIFITDESTLSLEMFWSGSGTKFNTIVLDAHPDNLIISAAGDPNFKHECDDLPCERFCFNIGSYKGQCGCSDTENGEFCKGMEFIFSSPEKVFLASVETNMNKTSSPSFSEFKVHLTRASTDQLNATFIDFHYLSQTFFWGEQPSGSIYNMRGVSQGAGSLTLKDSWEITAQQTSIEGLAVNWADSLLLWVDASVRHIMGSKFTGDHHSIYVNDLMEPRALALDPKKGVLYWSQLNEGSNREIVSVSCHGNRSIQKLMQLDHRDVGDLVFDIRRGRLYWSNPFSRQIYYFELDSKASISLNSNIDYLDKFTVFMDIIVATHPLKMQPMNSPLRFLNKSVDKNLDLVDRVQFITNNTNLENEFLSNTGDVVSYGNYLQPNPKIASCAKTNPCEQICLSANDVSVCKCAIGYKEDGNKCQTNLLGGPAIFFADSYHKQIYQISPASAAVDPSTKPIYEGLININSTFAFPHLPLIRPTQFVVDGDNGLVYIVDKNVLKVSDASNKKLEVVYPTNENKDVPVTITQIALDKTNSMIYITDLVNRIIFKLDLNNKKISIWKKDLVNPFAIAVDNRQVYWTEGGHLKSVNINDPNNETLLLDTLKNITSISIRSEENAIYVSDIDEGAIISYNQTDSSKTQLYQSQSWKIFKLASDDTYIYFTCWNMRGVYRISRWNETSVAELISAPIFSRIIDIAFVPVFVQSSELSKLPIILGILIPLLFLLLLLLLLLLFCLYRRKKNNSGPVKDPSHSSETMRDELVGVSDSEMFYPRLETVSIIPAEWENCYDNIDDFVTPAGQLELTDDPLVVPFDVSLLPNTAGISTEGNSRSHLLGDRPKHSILRMLKSERRVDPNIETPGAGATDHIDDTSNRLSSTNGAFSPTGTINSNPIANPSQSHPCDVLNVAGPDDKSLNLIGPERGNGAPSGRFVLIPPKLHEAPRGFAPASRSVPTAFKNTWGRIKNATKPILNFGNASKC